uniref:MADS-box domain-containing protein n=1 Tax=Manihot esculenta TaxID=3983 RepID=A0A2C9UF76_MANES
MGRRKIEMKMVKDSNSRQKSHELATLCSPQISIVIFSPGGKPVSFGHPSVESKLNNQLSELQRQVQFEKKKEQMLQTVMEANGTRSPKFLDEMSVDKLLKFKKAMEQLREKI